MGREGAPAVDEAEQARGRRIEEYGVLRTERELQFDRIVFTAAQLFRVPIAALAFIDGDFYWFKSLVGPFMPEIERSASFCQHLESREVLVVEDASMDKRFMNLAIVTGPPYVRFYAGAPLVTPDGLMVGSLCVIDRVPKTAMARHVQQLARLAETAVALVEERRPN